MDKERQIVILKRRIQYLQDLYRLEKGSLPETSAPSIAQLELLQEIERQLEIHRQSLKELETK